MSSSHSENGCRGAYKLEFLPPEPFLRFSQRTCPIHYFRSKTHDWGGFAQFCCRTSLIPKTGVAVHIKHEFLPPEPFIRFSQRTCPIHYFRSKTHVWGGFAQFRCRTSPIPKTGVGVHTKLEFFSTGTISSFSQRTCPTHYQSTTLGPKLMFGVVSRNFVAARHPFQKRVSGCIQARVFATGTISLFSQRTCPIHYFRSKTHVWGGFAQFRCRTSPIPKTGVGVHTSTSFCHRNHFFVFRNEHSQSTTLGPKHMFGVVSCNFVAARHPFRKRVSGCIEARVFATGTIFSFFATNMPNPLL
jgi:RNA polymerase subunit RPABC4/transcription elongation factor Spt4